MVPEVIEVQLFSATVLIPVLMSSSRLTEPIAASPLIDEPLLKSSSSSQPMNLDTGALFHHGPLCSCDALVAYSYD